MRGGTNCTCLSGFETKSSGIDTGNVNYVIFLILYNNVDMCEDIIITIFYYHTVCFAGLIF